MNWILPGRLAIGSHLDSIVAGKAGIQAVLSLDANHVPTHAIHAHIPLQDGENAPALVARAIRELARLLRESPPVLVHCHAGVSRSPAVVAGYLVTYGGYELQDALLFIDERRSIALSPGVLVSVRLAIADLARGN